jgi:MoxR-like ATPase
MHSTVTVTQKQLGELLLNLALVRPVFVWGQPGIGKSALVQEFAARIGLPCVSLLVDELSFCNTTGRDSYHLRTSC